jgi:hypothetical protein
MMEKIEKFAQADEGGGCTPTPFLQCLPSRTKLQFTLQLSWRADTIPPFHLYPYMYSVQTTLHTTICTVRYSIIHLICKNSSSRINSSIHNVNCEAADETVLNKV